MSMLLLSLWLCGCVPLCPGCAVVWGHAWPARLHQCGSAAGAHGAAQTRTIHMCRWVLASMDSSHAGNDRHCKSRQSSS